MKKMKRLSYILLCGLMLILSACEKDTESANFAPVVTTGTASNIYRMGATLSGSITLTETNTAQSYGILLSSFESMAEATEYPVKDGSTSYSVLIQNLEPGETYYYCAYASSGYSTAKSQIKSFTTTQSNAPVFNEVVLQSKDEKSCAVSTELLDDGGSELLMTGFVWGEAGSGDPTIKSNVVNVEPQGSRLSATIKGMEPNKTYLVRAYGVNAQGVGYSNSVSVTTNTATVPVLSDIIASDSTEVSITVKSTIVDAGLGEVTKVGFCYSSESKNPTTDHLVVEEIHGSPESEYFAAIIEGLKPETTYYIRAYAINEKGTGYSETFVYATPEPTLIEGNEGDVYVAEAGGLNEFVDDTNKYNIIKLKISGYLNGDDIRLIREMAGRDVNGNETPGRLVDLDISEATIVAGGDYYYLEDGQYKCWTSDNIIGKYMFSATILNRILLPNNAVSLGNCAFYGCTSLANISIPDNVVTMGIHTFRECTALTDVKLGNSVTKIDEYDFLGCTSLVNINIPNSVTSIGDFAFSECASLEQIDLPNSVTAIGMAAFQMVALTSIDLPVNITSIADQTFHGSPLLTTIEIPEGVTSIGRIAFSFCASLANVTIPSTVTSIDELAFYGCQSLAEVTSLATTPPALGGSVFTDIASPATLYVPTGCAPTYKASDWAQYFSTIKGEGDPEVPGIYTLDDLLAFRDAVNNGADISQWVDESNVINLYADIDATSIDNWTPIKELASKYVFNGNEHTILLKVRTIYEDRWALFDENSGTIQNLNVALDMIGSNDEGLNYAAICQDNRNLIINCHANVTAELKLTYQDFSGIALANFGDISQCTASGKISGGWARGGIVSSNSGTITDCVNNIDFSDGYYGLTGGIVIYNDGGEVLDCANNGDLISTSDDTGTTAYGGIIARMYNGTISGCVNNGDIRIAAAAVGGIVGNAGNWSGEDKTCIITNCSNTGNIEGLYDSPTGGIIGVLDGEDSEMTGCTYGGTVNGVAGDATNAIGEDMRSTSNDANINDIPTEEW